MIKWIKVLLTGVLVSFFYFPFEFKFLPGINTKMMLAAVGLVVLLYSWVRKREFAIPRELFFLLILSGVVSLVSLFSITYNQTPDTAYVSYIVSAAVWLSAAFTTCYIIYTVHGRLDITLLINYLTGVCVFQCIIAIAIDFSPTVMAFVDRFYVGGEYMRNLKRLYGIGAGLDVAGTRFSCVLICLSYLIAYRSDPLKNVQMYLYFLSFAIITVLGNMMARTTVVGAVIGLLFMVFFGIIYSPSRERNGRARLTGIIVTVLAAAIPMTVYYYRTNPEFYELTRFAFEGFFSLAEKGEWEVASNEMLKNMIVYPDEFKTWMIGDGYFLNQRYDPNYIGDATEGGFYMGTDIGYLRFIFYFGTIGLIAISAVMIYAGALCMKFYKDYSLMFFMILVAGFIMWAKSSTDIFVFFTFFICAYFVRLEEGDIEEEEEEEADDGLPETVS